MNWPDSMHTMNWRLWLFRIVSLGGLNGFFEESLTVLKNEENCLSFGE